MDTLLIGVVVCTALILLLVLVLNAASAKLVNSGDVQLVINGADAVATPAGGTLLSTFTDNNILLPSACGGGGTCAMCKCQIFEGGGDVLPTEEGHLTRAQQKDGWRLACQVKVKQDMKVKVPDEVFAIKEWECEVVSNKSVATFIK